MAKTTDDLRKYTTQYAMALLFEASGGTIGKPLVEIKETGLEFNDKRALFDSLSRYLGKEPEKEVESGFAKLASQLHGGTEVKRGRAKASAGNRAGATEIEDIYPR